MCIVVAGTFVLSFCGLYLFGTRKTQEALSSQAKENWETLSTEARFFSVKNE